MLAAVLLAIMMAVPVAALLTPQTDADLVLGDTSEARESYIAVGGSNFPWDGNDPIADLDYLDELRDSIGDLKERAGKEKLDGYTWPSDINAAIEGLESQYNTYLASVTDYINSAQLFLDAKNTEESAEATFQTEFGKVVGPSGLPLTKTYTGTALFVPYSKTITPQTDWLKGLNGFEAYAETGGGFPSFSDFGIIISSTGDTSIHDEKIWYAKVIADGNYGTAVTLLKGLWFVGALPKIPTDDITGYGNIMSSPGLIDSASGYSDAYDVAVTAGENVNSSASAKNAVRDLFDSTLGSVED
ncbi:MAG: hypothetical protein LBV63_03685, partial [Candidatus Methanoplasma sp.]|nr:hypothetical protein [Candidatus Methanoplasma sp.]